MWVQFCWKNDANFYSFIYQPTSYPWFRIHCCKIALKNFLKPKPKYPVIFFITHKDQTRCPSLTLTPCVSYFYCRERTGHSIFAKTAKTSCLAARYCRLCHTWQHTVPQRYVSQFGGYYPLHKKETGNNGKSLFPPILDWTWMRFSCYFVFLSR